MIAGIWVEVLGLERVGRQENFFVLGGHSLLAAQVMAQIERVFSTKLPLRILFTAPTVAGLAAHVEVPSRCYVSWTTPLVSIQPGGTHKPLFCVHPIGGSVFCYADLASAVGPDQLQAIAYCLEMAHIRPEDVAHIGFSLNPEKRRENK